MPDIEEAEKLLVNKAKEYGLEIALLHLVDVVIDLKREIEARQKVPQSEKTSVEMEHVRERHQMNLAETKVELAGLVDLIERIARNA